MVDTFPVQRHGFFHVEDRIVPGRLVEYPSARKFFAKKRLNAGSRMISAFQRPRMWLRANRAEG